MLDLMSSQHWLLTSIRLSFVTKVYSLFNVGGWHQASVGTWHQSDFYNQKIQHLYNVGGWRQANTGFWRQPHFNFQPKFFIYPTLVETSSQLWDLMSTFLFPTKFQCLSNVGGWRQTYTRFWRQPNFNF